MRIPGAPRRPSVWIAWGIILWMGITGSAAQRADGGYTRLKLEFECPAAAQTGESIVVRSVASNLDREVPVQSSAILFPDEIRSFGVQSSNGDEIHLLHRLLDPPRQPRTVQSNYGRYDLPLTIPFAQVALRPSTPGRPLTMEVRFQPARSGEFRVYFKTATKAANGVYDYYPKTGVTDPYDELAEVCRIQVSDGGAKPD